jgi:hypothetical protein
MMAAAFPSLRCQQAGAPPRRDRHRRGDHHHRDRDRHDRGDRGDADHVDGCARAIKNVAVTDAGGLRRFRRGESS